LTRVPPSIYVAIALIGFCLFVRPLLLHFPFQMVILRQAAPLGIAICGQAFVMRARSIDLSIGGIFVLTNYLVTSGRLDAFGPLAVLLVPLAVGAVIGLCNGVVITMLRASAVIVTLAVSSCLMGLVLLLSAGNAPGSAPAVVRMLGMMRVGDVPLAAIVWFVVAVLVAVPLTMLVYGRLLEAIGANPTAAKLSGLPTRSVVLTAHVLSGLLAAIGGLLLSGYIGVSSTRIGADVVMNAIAGAILGGITFGSGRKGVFGPAVAAYALTFLFNLLSALGAGEAGKLIVQGAVIAVAAVAAGFGGPGRR